MKNHIRIIRIFLFIISFVGLISAIFISLFMMTISCDSQSSVTIQCILIGGSIGLVVLAVYTVMPIIIAIGMKKPVRLIQILAIIFSLLIIFYFPVGTALGAYIIWAISKVRSEGQ